MCTYLTHLHSKWSILSVLTTYSTSCVSSVLFFGTPYTRVMYGIRQCNRIFYAVRLVYSLLKYFFQISVVILNSNNLHYQIFKFVIDNSDISLNCLQHIQKRRNFDAKVTCHQPICLLLHAILSGVGVCMCTNCFLR